MRGKRDGNTGAAAAQAAAGCRYLSRGWPRRRAWQRFCSDAGVVAARRPEEVTHAHRRCAMAQKKHVHGVGEKEQRQYEHIKEKAQKSGRYGKRTTEVAARTVLKQHKAKGHRKGQ